MAPGELNHENDTVVEADGIKIAYEPSLERYMQDAVVDYTRVVRYYVRVRRRSFC